MHTVKKVVGVFITFFVRRFNERNYDYKERKVALPANRIYDKIQVIEPKSRKRLPILSSTVNQQN
jgi:hypothetical protein